MKEFITVLEKEANLMAGLGFFGKKALTRIGKVGWKLPLLAGAATTIGPTAGRDVAKLKQQAAFGNLPKLPKRPTSGIYNMDAGPLSLMTLPFSLMKGGSSKGEDGND